MSDSTSVADVNAIEKDLDQNIEGSVDFNEDDPIAITDFEKADPLNDRSDERSSSGSSKPQQQSDSRSGVSSDEQKELFMLTSATEKAPPAPKKRKAQTNVSSRKQKPTKKSTTISVQTEWTWKDMEMLEQYRVREDKPETAPVEEEHEELEQEVVAEPVAPPPPKVSTTPEPAESVVSSLPELPVLNSVGPPPILQYFPESKRKSSELSRTSEQAVEAELRELGVHIHGHVQCEFCGEQLLKWPTIAEQEKFAPSQLFCCTEYREFVEAVLEMQREENQKIDSKQIDIQPHAKVRSRRARQLAEERAKTRYLERHLAEQKRLEEQAQKLAYAAQSKISDLQSGGSTEISQTPHKVADKRAAAKAMQEDCIYLDIVCTLVLMFIT